MILKYEQQLLNWIDHQVTDASDDELFAGGYLSGHISLAAMQCEEENLSSIEAFRQKVMANLIATKTELGPTDQAYVMAYWTQLEQRWLEASSEKLCGVEPLLLSR